MSKAKGKSSGGSSKEKEGAERRRSPRRPILDSFSLFVVVPKKGAHRLNVQDVSELGMGFDFDTEGEVFQDFPVEQGESLEVHFYLNQSLYLPLSLKVQRVTVLPNVRRVGAEFVDRKSKEYKAFQSFIGMLDQLSEIAKLSA